MVYLVLSIVFTVLFYLVVTYMSYITASILHRGIMYKLLFPIMKSLAFIIIIYTSIIADIVLYRGGNYETITFKNGVLSAVVVSSLVTPKEKGGKRK